MDAISPWTIYWVLQLDNIRGALEFVGVGGFVAAGVLVAWNGVSRFDTASFPRLCNVEARKAAWAVRSSVRNNVLAAAFPCFLAAALLPSSRTMAAIVVIPAVADNQTIQREAGELYDLAKQALRRAGDIKPDAKAADEEAR